MNREIQLHDCELSAVTHADGSMLIAFSTAYMHESSGLPGADPGVIWDQKATIKIEGTDSVAYSGPFPVWVFHGSLRIGQTIYEGFIPAEGHFEELTEFTITVSNDDDEDVRETFTVNWNGVRIELIGEPSDVEEFNECPRRSK